MINWLLSTGPPESPLRQVCVGKKENKTVTSWPGSKNEDGRQDKGEKEGEKER